MKFASFKINGTTSWGLIDGAEAVDLGALSRDRFPDLKSVIAAGALAEVAALAAKATAASARRHHLAAGDSQSRQDPLHRPQLRDAPQGNRPLRSREPHRVRPLRQQPDRASCRHHPPACVEGSRFRGRTRRHHRQAGPVYLARRCVGPHRRICLLQRRQRPRLSASHPSIHARQELSRDRRVRPLDGDAGRSRRSRRRCGCRPASTVRWFRTRPSAR